MAGIQACAQAGKTIFGVQVKPVVPLDLFDPVTTVQREALTGRIELKGGFSFGMNVRVGLSNAISLETGISQIRRAYDFQLFNDTNGYAGADRVRFVGYEVPLMGLVYIRLGERTWMNTALGLSIDLYPSDVQRDVEEGRIYIYRYNWVRTGILGNMGVEYRTDQHGTFYLGGSYHRPFNDMAVAEFTYYDRPSGFFPYNMRGVLDGSYLTLDVRYYFHEDIEKKDLRRRFDDF